MCMCAMAEVRVPVRYGGAFGVASLVAIILGWIFLLGSVLVPGHEGFLFVGVVLCSCGFLMEFALRSPLVKAD